jgi:hypothetical protein
VENDEEDDEEEDDEDDDEEDDEDDEDDDEEEDDEEEDASGFGKRSWYSRGICCLSSAIFLVNCTGMRTVFMSVNSFNNLHKTLPPS